MRRPATAPSVAQLLEDECYRFEFFQAVRLLLRLSPLRRNVGGDYPAEQEVARFRAHQTLGFPASSIQELVAADEQQPAIVTVNFMGMTGPQGALPEYYTQLVIDRMNGLDRHGNVRLEGKDHTLREFLDMFNHRLVSLFFKAWLKYRLVDQYERAATLERAAVEEGGPRLRAFVIEQRPRIDAVSQMPLDLAGFGQPALRYDTWQRRQLVPRTEIADNTLRFFAGLFAQMRRSALSLQAMLVEYFGVPVNIDQLRSRWLRLDLEDQTSLQLGGNHQLGVTAIAGQRVLDAEGMFGIQLGPLSYEQFCQFLPHGGAHRKLGHLVRLFVGPQFDFELQLQLWAREVPLCRLGGDQAPPMLGWTTWSRSGDLPSDVVSVALACRAE